MISTPDEMLFISWAPYSRRSEILAKELRIASHFIHYLKFQQPLFAPLKYVLQSLRTTLLLLTKRPRIVFVQDPPILASFVVYICQILDRGHTRFVVDAHSGAFLHPWWKPFRNLQKFVYRRALTVITTNRSLSKIVKTWGGNSISIAGPPLRIPSGGQMHLGERLNIVFICSFSPDEPLDVVLKSVAEFPDVHLFVTGDLNKLSRSKLKNATSNVTFTGFLPNEDYYRLLRGSDAIMVLTYKDLTLQLGGLEAVALGKPIITSDLPFLREYFSCGTVHISNTVRGVRSGIVRLRHDLGRLSKEIADLRRKHEDEWRLESRHLFELIGQV